ncbi:MAG TPA: hemolysin family protein [Verrucomicrobiae bacterium]
MVWSWYAIGAALVVAAACSFFFALAESALFALGRFRARRMLEDNPANGQKLAPLFKDPEDLVATLAFGNTLANALLIGLVVWILSRTYRSEFITGAIALIGILVGCEVIPKALAVRDPEFWSLRVAAVVNTFLNLTRPIRRIAQVMNAGILRIVIPKSIKPQPVISDEEYSDLLSIAQQQGALGKAEKDMIMQILALDQRTAGDVMNPRSQIAFISDELSKEEMLDEARRIKHTRIPIYDETPDTIVGVLNARAFLLNPSADLEEVIEFPSFVPQSMNLLQLLRSLQRQQRGIAIVLDEFGGTAGLVTMEDILEETLGRFGRKDPGKPVLERLAPGRWRVSGTCTLDEFRREYPNLAESDEVDTMSGLMVKQIEYVPSNGESVALDGLKLTATKVTERRVLELEVEAGKR